MPRGREVRKGVTEEEDRLVAVPILLLGSSFSGIFFAEPFQRNLVNKHISILRFLRLPTSPSMGLPCYSINLYENEKLSLDYFSMVKPLHTSFFKLSHLDRVVMSPKCLMKACRRAS